MKTKSYENVSESGYGVVRVGNFSANAAWEFFGVQPIIEVKMLGGEVSRRKGLLEYGKYTIWFDDTPDNLPKVRDVTSLMIDDKKIGSDATWWVISYLADDAKVGVELCNRPSG